VIAGFGRHASPERTKRARRAGSLQANLVNKGKEREKALA
jgi:hypothetical protein